MTTSKQQTLQGNWNEIKGKLKSKWGSLTDDDLMMFNGNVDQLVGAIQKKTGATRESIEHFVTELAGDGASAFGQAAESIRAGAQHAVEMVQETTKQAAASVRQGYEGAEDLVRQRPAESMAVCFGAGLVTGVVVTLMLRWR